MDCGKPDLKYGQMEIGGIIITDSVIKDAIIRQCSHTPVTFASQSHNRLYTSN